MVEITLKIKFDDEDVTKPVGGGATLIGADGEVVALVEFKDGEFVPRYDECRSKKSSEYAGVVTKRLVADAKILGKTYRQKFIPKPGGRSVGMLMYEDILEDIQEIVENAPGPIPLAGINTSLVKRDKVLTWQTVKKYIRILVDEGRIQGYRRGRYWYYLGNNHQLPDWLKADDVTKLSESSE